MTISIEQARLAKPKAADAVRGLATVVGVGLTRVAGSYAIKVNLLEAAPDAALPGAIDGVAILYEVFGPVRRCAAPGPPSPPLRLLSGPACLRRGPAHGRVLPKPLGPQGSP